MDRREIVAGLRLPEGPVAMPDGSVLLVGVERGCLVRVSPDGTIQVAAYLGNGQPERSGVRRAPR